MNIRALAASACLVLAGSQSPAATDARATLSSATATPALSPTPHSDSLKVAFIGGSITEGAFSSVPAESYAGLLTSWLRTHYKTVEARNTGLGGTGSEFGAYRTSHDMAGFAPDLAFIEFAVNDAGNQRPALFAHIDAIVYKLRQANPRVKIVYLSTTDVREEADRRAGRRASWVEDSAAAASYAGLQYIDVAAGIWAKVKGGTPVTHFFVDVVHPNDAGHRRYFEAIRDAMAPSIPLARQPRATGSRLIGQSKLDSARLEKGSSAAGCRPGALSLRYMEAALSCDRGDSFTYTFTGTTVGLVKAEVRDGGRLACTIDGGSPTTADFYSDATHIYERPFPLFLYRDLPSGRHRLACRVIDDLISLPQGTSTGRKVTVGYFMVSDERPVTL
ncbi:sialidase-1 [Novosphingobium chloroacetimidivorans]|uniref:Sialidase-1 n=1 Tax=Novosphingobium chloroacetimidivorans TaxID=1428314 RepID=A0A7W7K917_9SPHN|nr:SGNH/GDSL hydrolase family protein [Novosphingobium chloroacetimidivorans]MBB4858195.1 sialidase-1 [Novosphingobium chloroacetimidivorans]